MGKCCKKSKGKAKPATGTGDPAKEAAGSAKKASTTAGHGGIMGFSLGEAALAAGILVVLPVVLDRLAPNALRSIKNAFELASKN